MKNYGDRPTTKPLAAHRRAKRHSAQNVSLSPENHGREKAAQTTQKGGIKPIATSKRQKSLAAGLDECALSRYRREHPESQLSDDDALALLQARKAKLQNTLRERALAAGLSPQLVYHRISRNWPLDKALNTPSMPTSQAARIGGKARAQQKRERRQQRLQQVALKNARTL